MTEPQLESKSPQLKQNIGLFQAIMYGTGLILGAGIYVLIGDVAGIAAIGSGIGAYLILGSKRRRRK